MAAPTEIYVDPAINANSGSGTIGDPYGDLQYALNTATRDATNGNRINIKAGTSEILTGTLSYATYGTPTVGAPLLFQGYTASAGDGGLGAIGGNNGNFAIFPTTSYTWFKNLKIGNTGTAIPLTLADYSQCMQCEFHDSSNTLLNVANGSSSGGVFGCYFHDGSAAGVTTTGAAKIIGCVFKNGSSKKFTNAITLGALGMCSFTRFLLDGATNGISCLAGYYAVAHNNSIFSNAGTGNGIAWNLNAYGIWGMSCVGNIVSGFSGTGGIGIQFIGAGKMPQVSGNAVYNCATNYSLGGDNLLGSDNETLSSDPFVDAANGNLTPNNVGNVFAWGDIIAPTIGGGCNLAKGAVQRSSSGGGLVRGGSLTGGFQ